MKASIFADANEASTAIAQPQLRRELMTARNGARAGANEASAVSAHTPSLVLQETARGIAKLPSFAGRISALHAKFL